MIFRSLVVFLASASRRSRRAPLREPGKLLRRATAERTVRPARIVVLAPGRNDPARVREIQKPVLIQALVTHPPVEAFDNRVLHRATGIDEPDPNAVLIRPLIERAPGEFGAVVAHDFVRLPMDGGGRVQRALDGAILARQVIDDIEGAKGAATGERVSHEIHRPPLI